MNDGQRAAFADVLAFIRDDTRKYHRISGGAGTGKSFFISKIADDLLAHKPENSPLHTVVISATTNKAGAVLANSMPHRAIDIGTIFSHMNLRVSENWNTGETKVIPTKKWFVHHGEFIIIDEASMLNKEMMRYLEEGTSNSCKILFVGDKNQLSPVKEDISPAYANDYSESVLTEPMRNNEQPALVELCEQLVDTVKTGKFHPIKEVPGVIDFIDGNQMKGLLEREYAQEDHTKRVLCYTNAKVIGYNQFVRDVRGYGADLQLGEIVSNNEACEIKKGTLLYTDQLLRVTGTSKPRINPSIIRGHDIPVIDMELEDVDTLMRYPVTVFQDPEDRINVLKYFSKAKSWISFFQTKNGYPDLRCVAASTTHKAQGSTMSSVIVDLADIGTSTQKEQTARLLYVALSRPRQRLFLRGNLPDRYFA